MPFARLAGGVREGRSGAGGPDAAEEVPPVAHRGFAFASKVNKAAATAVTGRPIPMIRPICLVRIVVIG